MAGITIRVGLPQSSSIEIPYPLVALLVYIRVYTTTLAVDQVPQLTNIALILRVELLHTLLYRKLWDLWGVPE